MTRLSVLDLNNLSGNSDINMDNLYNQFRKSHTVLFNRATQWINYYDKNIVRILETRYRNDNKVFAESKNLYYEAMLLLIDIDLFIDLSKEYKSILSKLHKNETDIYNLLDLMVKLKNKILEGKNMLYNIFNEAYRRLEEVYYE